MHSSYEDAQYFEKRLNLINNILYSVNELLKNQHNVIMDMAEVLSYIHQNTNRLVNQSELITRLELKQLQTGVTKMNFNDFMTSLKNELAAMEDKQQATIKLLNSVTAQMEANKQDPIAMQAIIDRVRADTATLAAVTTVPNNTTNATDSVNGTSTGNDTINSTTNNDSVNSSSNTDTINSASGNDTLTVSNSETFNR